MKTPTLLFLTATLALAPMARGDKTDDALQDWSNEYIKQLRDIRDQAKSMSDKAHEMRISFAHWEVCSLNGTPYPVFIIGRDSCGIVAELPVLYPDTNRPTTAVALVPNTNWTGAIVNNQELGYIVTNHTATITYQDTTNTMVLKTTLSERLVWRKTPEPVWATNVVFPIYCITNRAVIYN